MRRAAVSSFGISGTNAHVIVEEAPAPRGVGTGGESGGGVGRVRSRVAGLAVPWVVSAKTEVALGAQAARLGSYLADHPSWVWLMWGCRWRRVGRGWSIGRRWSVLIVRELIAGLAGLAAGSRRRGGDRSRGGG